ncbi:MAG TPA: nitronate monooxygenase [Candidatus Acidoferrum sp.]|nr:nitronate monooxygenase [Candidatus Acidoferrum sp.]
MLELLKRLGIEHPVILSPMGGGSGTPELAAAVSNAGGLGSLGVAYLTPEQIIESVRQTRALTNRPINVNLFVGGVVVPSNFDSAPMLSILSEVYASLGLAAPPMPPQPRDTFAEQFEAVLEARPEVFSFTFGALDSLAISKLRSRGIAILGTATTVEEAELLAESGVDAIVAQGAEAGAHRGTFSVPFDAAMFPTSQLVRQIAPFAPVIASGGIMDGRDIRRMMDNGASATQLGTAFLPSPESGASLAYKRALLATKTDTTVITRVFSGRPARGLRNEFIARLEGREDVILPYPIQNALTRAMRTAAAQLGNAGFLSLWAGQGVTRCRTMPAGELVKQLVAELASS